jgi:heme exporter protein C
MTMRGNPSSLLSRVPLHLFSSSTLFHRVAGLLVPRLAIATLLLVLAALVIGMLAGPHHSRQGDAWLILFVHVPAAGMSLFLYLMMAAWAILSLALNARLPSLMISGLAPTGAMFTVVALWSGALLGKPAWGSRWVWDAGLTCELILLVLYAGVLTIPAMMDSPLRAVRAQAVLVVIGVLNLPIIYFSLSWWNTLHQGAGASLTGLPKARTMFGGMLVMALAFWTYANAVILARVRCLLLEREGSGAKERPYELG